MAFALPGTSIKKPKKILNKKERFSYLWTLNFCWLCLLLLVLQMALLWPRCSDWNTSIMQFFPFESLSFIHSVSECNLHGYGLEVASELFRHFEVINRSAFGGNPECVPRRLSVCRNQVYAPLEACIWRVMPVWCGAFFRGPYNYSNWPVPWLTPLYGRPESRGLWGVSNPIFFGGYQKGCEKQK